MLVRVGNKELIGVFTEAEESIQKDPDIKTVNLGFLVDPAAGKIVLQRPSTRRTELLEVGRQPWFEVFAEHFGYRAHGIVDLEGFAAKAAYGSFDVSDWAEVSRKSDTPLSWSIVDSRDLSLRGGYQVGRLRSNPNRILTSFIMNLEREGR